MKPADLEEVNDEVNALPYVADAARYHTSEFWARIDAEGGDCEDFALGKLNRLVERGWPISQLQLGCVYVETGEYHAVLLVTEADGAERVLDNRQNHVCSLDELARTGYKPDRIQKVGGSRDWVRWTWEA